MKREAYFLPLSCAAAVSAGMILKMSAKWSDTAAWSYIISPVSNTPWELFKPFAIAYMFWILIELSCLRPHLLHFVCSKSIGLYTLFFALFLFHYILSPLLPFDVFSAWTASAAAIIAECVSYSLYKSDIRVEIFSLPLLLTYLITVFLIIILTAAEMKYIGTAV